MICCGFYEKNITPPLGTTIPGYYAVRVATDVLDELYVKAFVADDGERKIAFLVLDAVEIPTVLCKKIAERIEQRTGIPAENVALSANHTHLGIPLDEPCGAKEDPEYTALLIRMAADCAELALKRMQPCELVYGMGKVDDISFNRDYVSADGSVWTNPGRKMEVVRPYGEIDPDVPVLMVKGEGGKPLGALISFACHQDCIGGTSFSGDFSSELSRQLKERYGKEFVSVYMAGACGDINHIDRMNNRKSNYLEMGKKLAAEAIRSIETGGLKVAAVDVDCRLKPVMGTYRRATKEEKEKARQVVESGQCDPRVMLGVLMSQLLLEHEKEMEGKEAQGELPVQVMRIGEALLFVLPGEMYHQFADRIKKACEGRKWLIATISNGDYGYLPTPEMFQTQVYPIRLCKGSRWEPQVGDMVVDRAIELAKELSIEKS